MSFAALCGSQRWNSVVSPPPDELSSLRTSELSGWSFASFGGGLKSICVSLLELSPRSSPREAASTLSERGGARFGLCAGADEVELGFCDFAGADGDEFCAAAKPTPRSNTIRKLRIGLCSLPSCCLRKASRQRL